VSAAGYDLGLDGVGGDQARHGVFIVQNDDVYGERACFDWGWLRQFSLADTLSARRTVD
jgi:hypothetical protein